MPKRKPGFHFQQQKNLRKTVDNDKQRHLVAIEGRELPHVRRLADMSQEELAELQAKADRVLNGHAGLNLRPFHPEAMEGL
jgi:hypothetical protein